MKPKAAFYWCASCGGCEEAVVDLAEGILDVVAAVDIVFWPVALDFKKRDIEALADGAIDIAFVNGAVRTSEQEEMAHLLRRKAARVVAFGSCAHLGGIPGLANFYSREAVLKRVYPDNGHKFEGLPELFDSVRALDRVIDVDWYLPGCPPPGKLLSQALAKILSGDLPEKGAVLAPDRALCEECPRRDSRPERVDAFRRPHEFIAGGTDCLMAQGLACLGPATRAGCDAACVQANMPCSGCAGPTTRVRDFGGKALSALASLAAGNEAADIERLLSGIPDPAGTFYRYSLPVSLLKPRPGGART